MQQAYRCSFTGDETGWMNGASNPSSISDDFDVRFLIC